MKLYKATQYLLISLGITATLFFTSLSFSLYQILNKSKYNRTIKERIQRINDLDERIEYLEGIKILTDKALERNLKTGKLDATCQKVIKEQL